MPAPHHLNFTGLPDALPDAQPVVLEQWR